jgi:hypothetical protein
MARDTCRWVIARLPLLAGGELIGLDRRRAERHLVGCAGCRERLGRQRAALEALHALGQVEPPAASGGSLWPALERQIAETRRQARPWTIRLPRRWLAAAAAAALAVVGVVVAWQVGRHYQLVVGLRPRIARVDPRPVFRPAIGDPTPPVAATARPSGGAASQAGTSRASSPGTPATASRDRRGAVAPTN